MPGTTRFILHYFNHICLPLVLSIVFFRKDWKKVFLIFLATMLVDLDHLLADPIYDAQRCSIGFHPLHTVYAMVVYGILLIPGKPWRLMGLGLLLHMATDYLDCLLTTTMYP